jgi:two-component system, cell cycle sensor histidine kinase and response regulator CckA
MIHLIKQLFDTGNFMSHGHCYLWLNSMVRLHLYSDLAIGLSYVFISLTLMYFVRRGKRDIPFHWMFLAFGTFIIACGATHLVEVWTLWTPVYWFSGAVKAVTACASVLTAFILPPLIPKSLTLIRAAKLSGERKTELEAAIAALRNEIGERRRAEDEFRKLNEQLELRVRQRTAELARANESLAEKAAIVQNSHDAIFSKNLEGVITSWNPAAEELYGYTAAEITGKSINILSPPDRIDEIVRIMEGARAGEHIEALETIRVRKDGRRCDVEVTVSPVRDGVGRTIGASVIARDVTERKRAERQLRETQKLESLGLIAGGVAHDFNNLLVGILGNASLALEAIPSSSPNHVLLKQVVMAGERASHLTRQLLAYAGKGRFVTEKLDLSVLVREISALIQTSIPKSVQLRLELALGLPLVLADPSQMQQLIMNLVINGAEAIGEEQNGTVLVTTDAQEVDEAYLRNNFAGEKARPGRYVVIEVHDSGCGMNEEVRSKLFDPFFSTKFTGRGLGLAAVLGIVRGHQGMIRVYSIPGKGSTFKVLLPAVEGTIGESNDDKVAQELRGAGTILVVDDEGMVRSTAKAALEYYGYTVLMAADGLAGLDILRECHGEIAAILLDMTMPVMSGEETFRRIRGMLPAARVIVSSGYNEVEAIRRFTSKGIAAFIQKPYTASGLASVIQRALG